MPIVRIVRDVNEQSDEEVPQTVITEFECPAPIRYLPRRSQLLASIKNLRVRSVTKNLEHSQTVIEKSRRIIFETELTLAKD